MGRTFKTKAGKSAKNRVKNSFTVFNVPSAMLKLTNEVADILSDSDEIGDILYMGEYSNMVLSMYGEDFTVRFTIADITVQLDDDYEANVCYEGYPEELLLTAQALAEELLCERDDAANKQPWWKLWA